MLRNVNKIVVKEVNYMDRTEFLIEELDLPSNENDDPILKAALEDKNVFLLKIQGQDVKTLKQINRSLKQKAIVPVNDGTTTSAPTTPNGYEDKIQITIGLPLLHSVRVQRAVEALNTPEPEKQGGHSPTLSIRSDGPSLTPTVRHRPIASAVKFDKSADSIAVPNQSPDVEDEQSQITDIVTKPSDTNIPKKSKQPRNSANDITLIMMNTDLLQHFQAQPTPPQKAEAYIEFNNQFEFQVSPNEKYLNVCLWCKPPLDCDVLYPGKKTYFTWLCYYCSFGDSTRCSYELQT